MRILWISDFGVHHNIGGAQRSNYLIIEEGKRKHFIQEFYYDTDPRILNASYDMVVSSNLEVLSRQRPDIISYISSHQNHVRLEHDANRYLQVEDRKHLFGNCVKTFFLSKFHYDKFLEMYGDIFINVVIVPDPIDTSIFYNKNEDRVDKVLYVGFMHYLKGTTNFLEYVSNNPRLKFAVASWGGSQYEHAARSMPNIEWLGRIQHDEMGALYNKYSTIYYHPVGFEPFCRSIGEAILCGMKLDCNDLIGSLHHLKRVGKEEFIKQCNEAVQMFWNGVEDCCV